MARRVGKANPLRMAVALIASTSLAACVDSGLPGKNLPLEEARTQPFRYEVYDASADLPAAEIGGLTWRAAGPVVHIAADLLEPVEAMGVHEAYRLRTDLPPVERVYVRTGEGLTPYARVDGGAMGAAEATHH